MNLNITQNENFENVLECNELNNDLIFVKYNVLENSYIKIKENQYVCLIKNGKILDIKENIGIYKIEDNGVDENYEGAKIRNAENENLCVVFINKSTIKNNKYFLKKPLEYVDWSYREEPLMIKIKGEGNFDFKIVNPVKFLENMVIGLRKHYSKQELIEQIRNYITNSIEKGIKEVAEEYKINIRDICEKSKEVEIQVNTNFYDEKLLQKGIKINYFDIEKLEINESQGIDTRAIEEHKKVYMCENCGEILENSDFYCKKCGTLNIYN